MQISKWEHKMIGEILYYIFVFPLESVLGFILTNLFIATKSYGFSIIILSLLVNLFLIKIFNLTDKRAEFESERKKRLDSRIKAWKSVYKKAKLFAFTQTLYRQNHYHPIFALSALGGLIVQIPFFYAMYFVIKNAEVLNSISFLWISDLSLPDSIFGIHILPILMTAISLINVWIVAKDKGARIQGVLIALIFLVLLYQMPSALVLYWTTNMLFSLLRAIWGNLSLNKHSADLLNFGRSQTPSLVSRPKFSKSNESHTENPSVVLNAKCADSGESNSELSLRESAGLKNSSKKSCHTDRSEVSKSHESKSQSESMNQKRINKSNPQTYRTISIYATLCIAFLICVFTPYQLYSTDITQFDSTQTYATLSALFGAFLLISFIVIYAISFVPKRFGNIIAFVFSLTLFVGIVYSFILVGDYGAMDRFILQKTPFIALDNIDEIIKQGREFVLVVASGSLVVAFALKKLKLPLQIILATLFIVSGVNAVQIINKQMESTSISIQSDKNKPPFADSPLFSYSKNDKNIVVIVLDMFSGSHTPYILEQFPQFKSALDGFVLFPNAISTTSSTIHSIATLIGGEYYAAYNMNKRKDNLSQSIDNAFIKTSNAFAESGFSVGLLVHQAGGKAYNLKPQLNDEIFVIFDRSNLFIDFYTHSDKMLHKNMMLNKSNIAQFEIYQLLNFGLFKFAPEFPLRPIIYNYENWLLNESDRRVYNASVSAKYSASFYAITHSLNTNANKPTFRFLHSDITHLPFGMYFNGRECEFFSDKSAWNDYPHKVVMNYPTDVGASLYYQHFDNESCALQYLSDYVDLLKNAGIYDNTQIFVVSDHSGFDSINIRNTEGGRPDSLLLFKDFGAKGALRVDNRLMANYDIASMFCANLKGGCPNVPKNILQNYPANREIIHLSLDWNISSHRPNEWLIEKAYKVKDNIYESKNWVDISDEKYGIVNVRE